MKLKHILLLSLASFLLLGGLATGQSTEPCGQTSFTLLYSSNVFGEDVPCG